MVCIFNNDVNLSAISLTDTYNYYLYAEGSVIMDRNYNNVAGMATNYIGGSRNKDLNKKGAAISNLSADPTMSDFNNLLTQLRTAGVIAP